MKFSATMAIKNTKKALMTACQLLFIQSSILAQDVQVDAAGINIPGGAYLVAHNVSTTSNSTITNNGTLEIKGNWSNTTGTNITGSGTYKFTTGSGQQIDAKNKSFYTIELDNDNGASLVSGLSIDNQLILTDGKLSLGNYNLTIADGATITGESSTAYISTASSDTGMLTRYLDTTQLEFPIGFDGASYVPVYIKCDSCDGSQTFSARVHDKAYTNPSDTTSPQLTSHVVTNTWVISSTSQKDIDLTVQWNPSDESLSQSTVNMGQWVGGSSTSWDQGTPGTRPLGTPRTFTRQGINAVNGTLCFGIGEAGSPLPVDLVAFTASWIKPGEMAKLEWSTASEQDNSHFEIERSYNGLDFEMIGTVAGNGNSISMNNYVFEDAKVECSGTVYYRLRQVDYNGDSEYSPTKSLDCERGTMDFQIEAYPNPNNGAFTVNVPENGMITLFSIDGKRAEQFTVQKGLNQIHTHRNGVFTLHFSSDNFHDQLKLIVE